MSRSSHLRQIAYDLGDRVLRLPGGSLVRRAVVAAVVKLIYREPWRRMRLVGITGTNGKTTTSLLTRHLLHGTSPAAALGTLGAMLQDGRLLRYEVEASSTPGPVEMARMLRRLLDEDIATVAMEVTAAAIQSGRVDQLSFDVAVFTNFTRDHLDIFGTMERYHRAKLELASRVSDTGVLVINADDPAWSSLMTPTTARQLTYGIRQTADVRATDIASTDAGTTFRLWTPRGDTDITTPLIGEFNVYNLLAACSAALALSTPLEDIGPRLSTSPAIPGRLERIGSLPCPIYRDFAHTPDALQSVLVGLRPTLKGRLILVFGAGGNLDKGKRPLMGELAIRYADLVIVSSTNPRYEDPEAIIDQIVDPLDPGSYIREINREQAVRLAVSLGREGDAILLTGLGHQDYQEIRGRKLPFSEPEIVADEERLITESRRVEAPVPEGTSGLDSKG